MRRVRRWVLVVPLLLSASLVPAPASASNDARFPEQWNLAMVGAPAAWPSTTGKGVRIGIVDTGVDLNHEELAGRVVEHTSCIGAKGDSSKCSGSGQDDQGHGTHVAGIAAATKDNGVGIAGVAPEADLVVAKVLDAKGSGEDADVNAGIHWVVDHGARVVNLSLGDPAFLITSLFGTAMREGILYAASKGAVVVLAAGNTNLLGLGVGSSDYGPLPAIVTGSVDRRDRVAGYSSPLGSAKWALLAPGGTGANVPAEDVLSSWWKDGTPNTYEAHAGTSMAAPHVTGTVALLLARGLTPQAAIQRVLDTANPAISCGANSPTCRGRLDVGKAVTGIATPPLPVPPGTLAATPLPLLTTLLNLLRGLLPLSTARLR